MLVLITSLNMNCETGNFNERTHHAMGAVIAQLLLLLPLLLHRLPACIEQAVLIQAHFAVDHSTFALYCSAATATAAATDNTRAEPQISQ